MSPLIYDPRVHQHDCALPIHRWMDGALACSRPSYSVGAVWECDECGQRYRVAATSRLDRAIFGYPSARWVLTKDQSPMHEPTDPEPDTEKETRP